MRTQNHRTRIQNTSVTRRRAASVASGTASRSRSASRGGNKSDHRKHGTRAIWLLMFIGGMIAAGFILAQRSQINAHQLKHVEEELKSELDTLSSQQRYLIFQKERALSTKESDRAAKESGLIQPKLDRANARQVQPDQAAEAESKPVAKSASRAPKQSGNTAMAKPSKSSASPSNKQVNKQAQSVKSNKDGKAKEGKAKAVQTGKPVIKGKTQQLAQNQTSRKGSTSQDKRR